MVFLIQNTQNRDAKAVHLKLDELIRALGPARNKLVDLEGLSDDDLKKLEKEFQKIRKKAEGAKDEVEDSRAPLRPGRPGGFQRARFSAPDENLPAGT